MTAAPDLVVRGGTVLDGTGGPAVEADVRISGGRIESIGRHPLSEEVAEIDATGLFVAPGSSTSTATRTSPCSSTRAR